MVVISMAVSVRPSAANSSISARVSGQGGPGCGSPALSWTSAMTSRVPPGAVSRATLVVAWCRRARGRACTVMISATRSNACSQDRGECSRSEVAYLTGESGCRRRASRVAVGEISKAAVATRARRGIRRRRRARSRALWPASPHRPDDGAAPIRRAAGGARGGSTGETLFRRRPRRRGGRTTLWGHPRRARLRPAGLPRLRHAPVRAQARPETCAANLRAAPAGRTGQTEASPPSPTITCG